MTKPKILVVPVIRLRRRHRLDLSLPHWCVFLRKVQVISTQALMKLGALGLAGAEKRLARAVVASYCNGDRRDRGILWRNRPW
jgi:hypothetical protein